MRWLSVTPLASGHACNELATPLALRHVCRSRSRADVRPFMARTDAPAALDRRLTIHGHTERLRRRAVLHPGVPRTLVSEIDRRSSQSPDERSGAGQVAPLASATRAGKVAVCATSQSHPWPSAMCATEKSPCAQRVSHAPGFGHACTPDRVWVTLGLAGWRPPSPAETAGCAHMATGGNSSRAHLPALIRSSLVGASR